METTQRRAPKTNDVSDAERENLEEEEEFVGEEATKEWLLRAVVKLGSREKMKVLMYRGNLNVEEFLD